MVALVVLVTAQIDWKERLWNDLRAKWDVKA